MMKTVLKRSVCILLLLTLLCMSLTGCQSPNSKSVDNMFAQLDTDAPDPEALRQAREAYEALTPKEWADLKNYDRFVEAETQQRAIEADALVEAIGEVTLDSGPAIAAAREVFDALDEDARIQTERYGDLTAAEERFHQLTVENAAAGIDALIKAVGKVTLKSAPAIEAARAAYEAADEEVRACVSSEATLSAAEKTLHKLEVSQAAKDFDAEITALGEITLESESSVAALRKAYGELPEEVRKEVRELPALTAAEETLVYLGELEKAKELDAAIAAIGTVTLDKEQDIQSLRERYEALPENVRGTVSHAGTLSKAERSLQGLHDKAAAAEIKKLTEEKQYDDAIARAEEYIGERALSDVQGGVVKNCLNAYVQKAESLRKQGQNENAYNLLRSCKAKYAGADLSGVSNALKALNKTITEPKNGQLFSSSARGGYNMITIKAGSSPLFVKIVHDRNPNQISVYVRANQRVVLHIQNGSYSVRYATGSKWFGSSELFGSNTRFYAAETTLECSASRRANYVTYQEYELKLYRVNNGNLPTKVIPKDQF